MFDTIPNHYIHSKTPNPLPAPQYGQFAHGQASAQRVSLSFPLLYCFHMLGITFSEAWVCHPDAHLTLYFISSEKFIFMSKPPSTSRVLSPLSRVLSPRVEGSHPALLTCLPTTAVQPYSIRKYITVQLGVQVYLSIQVYSALCWIFVCSILILHL